MADLVRKLILALCGVAFCLGTAAEAAPAKPRKIPVTPVEIRTALCEVIGTGPPRPGSLTSELWDITGLTGTESEAVKEQRIRAWFRERQALPREQSGLTCDEFLPAIPGFKGGLYRLAIALDDHQRIWELTKLGLAPNWRDPATGKTPIEDMLAAIDTQLKVDEVVDAPWHRLTSVMVPHVRYNLLRQMDSYKSLREAGARLAGEGQPSPPPACAATAADAPAPGIPYDGKLGPGGSGPTPDHIPGVQTISARQAACLLDKYGKDMLVLGALRDAVVIPGTEEFAYAGASGAFDDKVQYFVRENLHTFTFMHDAKKARPIMVYCHHENCRNSYNAILRMQFEGYTNIYWLREGLKAWKAAGYPLGGLRRNQPIRPFERY